MLPYKHLQDGNKDQSVLSFALAKLCLDDANIPVVAQSYEDKIITAWWSVGNGDEEPCWKTFVREHFPMYFPLDIETHKEQSLYAVAALDWSNEIGMTSIEGYVYQAYKRRLMNGVRSLFVEKMRWESDSHELHQSDAIPIPLDDLGIAWTGFQVRVENIGNRLAIIFQAWRDYNGEIKPELCVMMAENPITDDLSDIDSWNVIRIGDGGWDFDARASDSKLHIVFREEAYPLEIQANIEPTQIPSSFGTISCEPIDVDISSSNWFESRYHPLCLAVVSGIDAEVEELISSIPGGEHPQIHALDPLCISVDRVLTGTIRVTNQYRCNWNQWWRPRKRWLLVDFNISSYEKILIRRQVGLWALGRVYEPTDEPMSPRNYSFGKAIQNIVSITKESNAEEHLFGFATLNRYRPVWMTYQGTSTEVDNKSEVIDFLAHDTLSGSLVLSRFQIGITSESLAPTLIGFSVIDINHGPIPSPWAISGESHLETMQFSPWTAKRPEDVNAPLRQIVSGEQIGDLETYFPRVDNTIGGALMMHSGSAPLSFYAYTDLGDGGSRVVFSEDIRPSDPIPGVPEKGIKEDHITGSASENIQEVVLTTEDDWAGCDHGSYWIGEVKAPLSGIDFRFDTLLSFLPETSPSFWIITQEATSEVERILHMFMQLEWVAVEADPNGGGDAMANFKYSPRSPFPNNMVRFKAEYPEQEEIGTAYYQWEFGDGIVLEGREIDRVFTSFDDPENRECDVILTVIDAEGSSYQSETTIRFQTPLWDSIWNFHKSLTTQEEAEVHGCEIRFSKYAFSFITDEEGNPNEVRVDHLAQWLADYRFVGDSYGQGGIDLRLPIKLFSENVAVKGTARAIVKIDTFFVECSYGRRYTPCVLMSEKRNNDPLTNRYSGHYEILQGSPAALAAKPISNTSVDITKVSVEMSITPSGMIVGTLIDILTVLGLFWVIVIISSALSAAAAAAASGPWGWIIAVAIMVGLAVFIAFGIPKILSSMAEDRIRAWLASEEFKTMLDANHLLTNSGEGLAECVAVAALKKINNAEPEATGKHRMKPHFWQMIYVATRKCKIWYRI